MDQQLPLSRRPTVVVLGGGLAGIAAALDLSRHGCRVTLVERRRYLGGRAFSFTDRETGLEVDNGQHVFLGCCTAYRRFVRELGADHLAHLQSRLSLQVLVPGGSCHTLGESWLPLPAPLHLLPSFLRYRGLGWIDRVRVLFALARIWRLDRTRHWELERQTFYQWLKACGQSERSIERFWNLIVLPTLNDDARVVSADMAVMVFQEGLLRTRDAGRVGYSHVGLSALVGRPAEQRLAEQGVDLRLGCSIKRVTVAGDIVTGVDLGSGERLTADAYVSALPFTGLSSVLPRTSLDSPFFESMARLDWSPIVNLHIWLDRPVMEAEFLAVVESPLQWVFNKTRISGLDGPGQCLTVSVSGAREWWGRPKREVIDGLVRELRRVFPGAGDARVIHAVVVQEGRATVRCLPGAARDRLPAKTPLWNLFLAGEWTDTGWPSTMEGAVRSGYHAAALARGLVCV